MENNIKSENLRRTSTLTPAQRERKAKQAVQMLGVAAALGKMTMPDVDELIKICKRAGINLIWTNRY